ncbi:glycoside hydrolase family 16 protein [Streptomyces sp. NPDC002205]|uniref:glycoside hydrolase family 16 protein n=1 Tax=Streptomyces sp. NPDC002205 TaxID=3154411 RepID=UPI0033178183
MVQPRTALRRLAVTCAAPAACAVLATAPAGAEESPPLVDPATPAGVQPLGVGPRAAQALVFSDEFTGTALDTSKWTARDQERTESSRTDGNRWWYKPGSVRVITDNGGNLAIDLTKLADKQYAGGRVDSQGKFDYTHGTLEARVHTPYATGGHLAAVWLQASAGRSDVDADAGLP